MRCLVQVELPVAEPALREFVLECLEVKPQDSFSTPHCTDQLDHTIQANGWWNIQANTGFKTRSLPSDRLDGLACKVDVKHACNVHCI